MSICRIVIDGIVNRIEAKNIGGTALVKLGVKVRTGFGDNAQKTYFNVDIWGRKGSSDLTPGQSAAIAQLKDGSPVVVAGKFQPREYEGKNGKAISMDIRCSDWSKPRSFEGMNSQLNTSGAMQGTDSSDIPF